MIHLRQYLFFIINVIEYLNIIFTFIYPIEAACVLNKRPFQEKGKTKNKVSRKGKSKPSPRYFPVERIIRCLLLGIFWISSIVAFNCFFPMPPFRRNRWGTCSCKADFNRSRCSSRSLKIRHYRPSWCALRISCIINLFLYYSIELRYLKHTQELIKDHSGKVWQRQNFTKALAPTAIFRNPKCPNRAFCANRLLNLSKN